MLERLLQLLKGDRGQAGPSTVIPSPFHLTDSLSDITDFFSGYDIHADPVLKTGSGLAGYCFVCQQDVLFEIDRPADGTEVNWRETVKCPHCRMINRWRACIHLFHHVCRPTDKAHIYLTEALSPTQKYLSRHFEHLSASEYFPDHEPGEEVIRLLQSIRNEDVTRLSFPDRQFDAILSFDVLEHVPDYRKALGEFRRVLKRNGHLVLTAPFNFQQETTVRATMRDDGTVEHILEPCYHGDPLSDQGVLAFYDFGMDLVDTMKDLGFRQVEVAYFRSNVWGYPAGNVAFIAG